LVLDAQQRSALATTRALGRHGGDVVTADSTGSTLAGKSRYSSASLVYPCPYREPDAFIAALPALAAEAEVDVILPMTEVTTYLLSHGRDAFRAFGLPLAEPGAFETLSDKYRLFRQAREVGVPTPATWFMDTAADVAALAPELPYPVVIKPFRSRILDGGRWLTTSVSFADSPDALCRKVAEDEALQRFPFLLQDYVDGVGAGVFAYYEQGEPMALFAHRRLRERPPAGGVSVLSESVAMRDDMAAMATRLLGTVHWHGPAMVEFKVAADGTPYLMEINPRLWGSLQLAVDAGVNFPMMLYRSASGEPQEPVNGYTVGRRLRWLLGDVDRLYMVLRDGRRSLGGRGLEALRFLWPGWGRTRYEVNRFGDMGPFWHELRHYLDD
jgi:predicted ATP-grasp superfamily ATP-dependent carboligase